MSRSARRELLARLIEAARDRKMSRAEREEQMLDFVYGNLLEADEGTREDVRTRLGLDPKRPTERSGA